MDRLSAADASVSLNRMSLLCDALHKPFDKTILARIQESARLSRLSTPSSYHPDQGEEVSYASLSMQNMRRGCVII